ncbi:MAG: VWA domain-containing protein, partial [bacterium]|nr:VWA domain-containing protein [bacterium]
ASGSSGGMFWLCVLLIEVALAVGVFYASLYSHLGVGRLVSLMSLRCAAIGALMLILFKPAIHVAVGADTSRPLLPILVDRSGSMATMDQGDVTRYAQVVVALSAHQERIERYFRPLWFHFAESTEEAESLNALSRIGPKGEGTDGTDISAALAAAAAVRDREEPAGILMFSDGNPTKGSSVTQMAREAAVPTFAIGVGNRSDAISARPNIEMLSADMPFEAVKNNVTTLNVRVRITALPNSAVQLVLREQGI